MSIESNHDCFEDFRPLEDFEDDAGADLADGLAWEDYEAYSAWCDAVEAGLADPLPEAEGLCCDGLHELGTCDCHPPF